MIRLKLMICISQLSKGGAERVVVNLANYLSQTNDVTIVVFRKGTVQYDVNDKVKTIELDKVDTENHKIIRNIKRIIKLNSVLKKEKYDVTLSFLPKPSYMMLFLKLFRKNKVIVSVRNDPRIEYKSFISRALMKWLYPRADGFVFQTEDARNYFSEEIKEKSVVIANSLNKDFIVDSFSKKRTNAIVTVGRLAKQKNHKLLIDAFEKFNKEVSNCKLIIYGDGSDRSNLQEYINSKNLQNKVFLAGQISDVKKKIYDARMFVLSSDYEGMPNALMEALAMGIPCISTNCPCGGPKMLITNNFNGFLVSVNDSDLLCKSMLRLYNNQELQNKFSQNSIARMKKYNPNIINKKWLDYFKKINSSK